ncbi:hypothetical protein [Burkholderia plantarii]|uniref:hypothetical protein n=1 Tax=Burkholderia plantarii TaxID=41899 RepID=UPI000A4E504C|nr:hypothetical protein [Burkholderia plantarii]
MARMLPGGADAPRRRYGEDRSPRRACAAGHAGDILVTAAAAREYVEVVGDRRRRPAENAVARLDGCR